MCETRVIQICFYDTKSIIRFGTPAHVLPIARGDSSQALVPLCAADGLVALRQRTA